MLAVTFFSQYLFALLAGLIVSILVGGGSTGLYLSQRSRRTRQLAWGRDAPTYIASYFTFSLRLNIISLAGGLLLFFGILGADVSFKGNVLDGWTLVFVATAALLSFANVIFIITRVKRREKLLLPKIAPKEAEKQVE